MGDVRIWWGVAMCVCFGKGFSNTNPKETQPRFWVGLGVEGFGFNVAAVRAGGGGNFEHTCPH